MSRRLWRQVLLAVALLLPLGAFAAAIPGAGDAAGALASNGGVPVFNVTTSGGGQTYSLTLQVLLLMTLLTLLPAVLLGMTAFTRIIIVLSILRQALGMPQTPPNQVMVGLALFLTLFVMSPVLTPAWNQGAKPYLDGQLSGEVALERTLAPVRGFMLRQVRTSDLETFRRLAHAPAYATPADVSMTVLMPAFLTSELKTAFQIGFMIFIPFLIIDLVVASVLMSMGMMMLSPMLVSLPFKLMLFVLVDGWALLSATLVASFG
ncbi:MAG: hypothetical protein RJB26_1530 [Pseudomonadota bacterium]